ncbi:MAG TPA: hypothetical protein VK524_13890 [Polyangiaceae bacterium]|nr:hypothetical protein [Polyangiaceae bacterium]
MQLSQHSSLFALLTLAGSLIAASACGPQPPQGTGGTGGSSGAGGSAGTGGSTGPFPPADLTKNGPFASMVVNNSGPGNTYTLYLPSPLAPNGAKNPIVGWMSGGGTNPSIYTLLPRLATHGFVVVASNTVPGVGTEEALGREIIAGIDWAIAENGRAGSTLFGKLDTTKIASMGYSMGSLATFTIASDPRLTTTVHVSGGNFVPERVQNLRAPAAFLCGQTGGATCNILSPDCDIAAAQCDRDFANATTPVFYGKFPAGHLGILQEPHANRIATAITGWLRWKLMSDTTLAGMFVGGQCTLCSDPNWTVQRKAL